MARGIINPWSRAARIQQFDVLARVGERGFTPPGQVAVRRPRKIRAENYVPAGSKRSPYVAMQPKPMGPHLQSPSEKQFTAYSKQARGSKNE